MMWYEGKGIVSIGCQTGGPKDNGIGKIKVDLWKQLCEFCTSTYCDEIDHYALALRVGGKFADYDEEKIWKIRRSKKERFIGIDIDIPMSTWSSKTTNELKLYLSDKVIEAIDLIILRLKKDNLTTNDQALLKEIGQAISAFKENDYDNMV